MKALLLAGGIGSRLRPITDHTPKCLVPIGGTPLLNFWLESLLKSGFEEIFINTFHHRHLVEQHIKASKFADNVVLINEDRLVGTVAL